MKWFKHQTASHTDEKLALLQAEFGLEGYGFYWLTLELIAKQMEAGSDKTFVEYPISFWRKFYGFSLKKLQKLAGFCSDFEIFSIHFTKKTLRIDCPNLLKYRDEWSRKKSKNSGVTPEPLLPKDLDTELEEEKKEEERENTACAHVDPPDPVEGDPPPPSGPKKTDCPSLGRPSRHGFMACWQVYPIQQGQEEAWREWCRLEDNGTLEEAWAIRDKILMMAQEDDRWLDGFAPKMAKWLNGKGWQDQPYKKPKASPQGGQHQGQPRASTQAQKNSQDREGMALAVLKARENRKHAENIQGQNSGRIGGTGSALPSGDDWSDADSPPARCLGS